MTLVPVRNPIRTSIAKSYDADAEATEVMLGIALYETFCDFVECYGPVVDADIAKRLPIARAAITREYIAKRAAGEDVAPLLEAAAELTMIERATIAKDDKHDVSHERRNAFGRWVRSGSGEGGLRDLVEPSKNEDRRGYRQLRASGQALAAVSTASGNAGGVAAGATAQLIGELGPEAERILGTNVRRTAYRYRGTERPPSKAIQDDAHTLAQMSDAAGKGHAFTDPTVRAVRGPGQAPGRSGDPVHAIATAYTTGGLGNGLSPDERTLAMSSDLATMNLASSLPDLHHAQLSLKSGKMPPSIGYIVDADGDIVSQSQGYNGDHYLPFDLAHLSALHGGAYTRTRTTGGPTDEDIYTALMTGTRQLTVASHSGVFTVEFDPDLRGGKRYSDKARQMTGRYAALLERIGSGQHMQRNFSPEDRERMRAQALRQAPGQDPAKAREILRTLEDRERESLKFSSDDEIDAQARERVAAQMRGDRQGARGVQMSRPQEEAAVREEAQRIRTQEAAKVYRLDGEGYKAALTALKQEFPFYIKSVKTQTWPEYTTSLNLPGIGPTATRHADIGHTRRGMLAPVAVGGRDAGESAERSAEKATTKATEAPAAAAATPSVDQVDNSAMKTKLAATLRRSLPATEIVGEEAAPEGISSLPENEAALEGAESYSYWLRAKFGTNYDQMAEWLLEKASPEHLNQVGKTLGYFRTQVDRNVLDEDERANIHLRNPALKDFDAVIDQAKMVREPYAKSSGDTALSVADKPQAFADTTLGFTSMQPYIDAAHADPELAEKVEIYQGMKDPAIADEIRGEVESYKALASYGKARAGGEVHPADIPQGMRGKEDAADEAASLGKGSPAYLEIERSQKAWSLLRGMQVTSALTGAEVPKVTAPARDAGPKVSKRHESAKPWEHSLREAALALGLDPDSL